MTLCLCVFYMFAHVFVLCLHVLSCVYLQGDLITCVSACVSVTLSQDVDLEVCVFVCVCTWAQIQLNY